MKMPSDCETLDDMAECFGWTQAKKVNVERGMYTFLLTMMTGKSADTIIEERWGSTADRSGILSEFQSLENL